MFFFITGLAFKIPKGGYHAASTVSYRAYHEQVLERVMLVGKAKGYFNILIDFKRFTFFRNSTNNLDDPAMLELRPIIKRFIERLLLYHTLTSRYGSQAYLGGTSNSLLDSSNVPSRKTSAASHYGVYLGR